MTWLSQSGSFGNYESYQIAQIRKLSALDNKLSTISAFSSTTNALYFLLELIFLLAQTQVIRIKLKITDNQFFCRQVILQPQSPLTNPGRLTKKHKAEEEEVGFNFEKNMVALLKMLFMTTEWCDNDDRMMVAENKSHIMCQKVVTVITLTFGFW